MASYSKQGKTWTVRFRANQNGKEVYKRLSGYRTKKDAEKAYADFCAENDALKLQSSVALTFDELMNSYLAFKKTRLKSSSYYDTENKIRKNIEPFFTKKRVSSINSTKIIEWQTSISELAESYQKTLHGYLTSIFKYGETHYGTPNPAKNVPPPCVPDEQEEEMQIWEPEEFASFYKAILPEYEAEALFFRLLFCTGMRRGEGLALSPADIRTVRGEKTVNVDKSLSFKPTTHITTPKNKASKRKIVIDEQIYKDLTKYISEHRIRSSERIFNFSENTLKRRFEKYSDIAGIKKIRVHDLRHSHVSYLISSGINIVAISRRLGHKDVEQTLNTYAHLMAIDDAKMNTCIEGLITALGLKK